MGMEHEIDKTIEEYQKILEENWKTDPEFKRWKETCNSDYLIKFFRDKEIFIAFLESVVNDNVYCEYKPKNLRINLDKLKFYKDGNKIYKEFAPELKTDICIEGENFICVIENKFGSDSHGRKNDRYQCAYYRKFILEHSDKEYKIFIRLDNEHNSLRECDVSFLKKTDEYGGYYNAWFARNVLKTLKNFPNHELYGNEITKYCNFLKETTIKHGSEIQKEFLSRGKKITSLLNQVLTKYQLAAKFDKYYGEICIENNCFLLQYEYLKLSLLNDDEKIKNLLEEQIAQWRNIKF